jgi:hypothetical protein
MDIVEIGWRSVTYREGGSVTKLNLDTYWKLDLYALITTTTNDNNLKQFLRKIFFTIGSLLEGSSGTTWTYSSSWSKTMARLARFLNSN